MSLRTRLHYVREASALPNFDPGRYPFSDRSGETPQPGTGRSQGCPQPRCRLLQPLGQHQEAQDRLPAQELVLQPAASLKQTWDEPSFLFQASCTGRVCEPRPHALRPVQARRLWTCIVRAASFFAGLTTDILAHDFWVPGVDSRLCCAKFKDKEIFKEILVTTDASACLYATRATNDRGVETCKFMSCAASQRRTSAAKSRRMPHGRQRPVTRCLNR